MYGEGGNRGGGFRPRGGGYGGGSGGYGGGSGGGFGGGGVAPVNVGDEIDVKIEAVGEKGDGIARKKGFVLFVPNTREGDEVRIRITKVLRKVGFADVIGKAQGAPESSAPKAEAAPYVRPQPAPDMPEDSEDFGEESEAPEVSGESEDMGDDSGDSVEADDAGDEAPADETGEEVPEPPELPEEPEDEEKKEE